MEFSINKNLPITTQIYEQVCMMILKDKLVANTKILSVRDFALLIGVNPNTVQKSYELLEKSKVIYSVRGSGWYVSENILVIEEVVQNVIKKKIGLFLEEMKKLDVSKSMLINYINERSNLYE